MPPSHPHFAFTGSVIRLIPADLERWRGRFKNIPNLEAELESYDTYLVSEGLTNGDKWFPRAAAYLATRDAGYLAKLPEDRKPRSPNPQFEDLDYGPS